MKSISIASVILALISTSIFAMELMVEPTVDTTNPLRPQAYITQMRIENMTVGWQDLKTKVFSDYVIQFNSFNHAELDNWIMQRSLIQFNNFMSAKITNASFADAIIKNNNTFIRASIINSSLNQATIQGNWKESTINDSSMQNAKIMKASFRDATFTKVDMSYAQIEKSSFKNAVLENVDLSNARISSSNLSGVKLKNVILSGAILSKVKIKGAQIWDEEMNTYRKLMANDLKPIMPAISTPSTSRETASPAEEAL
ncbi:MAG TPA: pentapeptide repeat-containing protein [Myxococcota bacterium]|nr:pentapeptide repeat-containing protein [Myxococcota bacterium]